MLGKFIGNFVIAFFTLFHYATFPHFTLQMGFFKKTETSLEK